MLEDGWYARIYSEGDPILVADVEDYPSWGGEGDPGDESAYLGSDYRRALTGLGRADAAVVRFGPNHDPAAAVLWTAHGGGGVDIAVLDDGFLLLRTWLDADQPDISHAAARRRALTATGTEPGAEVTFGTGRLMVICASTCLADLEPATDVQTLRQVAGTDPAVGLDGSAWCGVGTVLQVSPGTYRVACAEHQEPSWTARWARFTRRVQPLLPAITPQRREYVLDVHPSDSRSSTP
jgi:hypothetical protein